MENLKEKFLSKCDAEILNVEVTDTFNKTPIVDICIMISLKGINYILLSKEDLSILIKMIEDEEQYVKDNGSPSYIK